MIRALATCVLLAGPALLAGCNGAVSDAVAATPAPSTRRVPVRSELVCFPCHSYVKFDQGPGFPHGLAAHRAAGHCHTCHQGKGHEPREIDRTACLTCHEEGAKELKRRATRGRKSN